VLTTQHTSISKKLILTSLASGDPPTGVVPFKSHGVLFYLGTSCDAVSSGYEYYLEYCKPQQKCFLLKTCFIPLHYACLKYLIYLTHPDLEEVTP
jgi:hypothetical protein